MLAYCVEPLWCFANTNIQTALDEHNHCTHAGFSHLHKNTKKGSNNQGVSINQISLGPRTVIV